MTPVMQNSDFSNILSSTDNSELVVTFSSSSFVILRINSKKLIQLSTMIVKPHLRVSRMHARRHGQLPFFKDCILTQTACHTLQNIITIINNPAISRGKFYRNNRPKAVFTFFPQMICHVKTKSRY